MLYFYLDNGSNVCGLEFNYKNGEEEGDSSLKEEKEDKKLEEGEETKQYKMEGLGENGDNKSLLADKQTSKQTNNCLVQKSEKASLCCSQTSLRSDDDIWQIRVA